MRRHVVLFVAIILLSSCIALAAPRSVEEVKESSTCLEYHGGMGWLEIANTFGEPDIAPKPEPGTDLSMNARGYQDLTVIFYTKRKRVNEDGKIRFKEVVYKIEICKRK